MQIAAQLAFDQRGAAGDIAAAEIPFRCDVDLAVSANRTAEAGRDFVITQIQMRAALWTGRGARTRDDVLLGLAIEAFDRRAALLSPESVELVEQRRLDVRDNGRNRRGGRFARRAQLYFRLLRRAGREVAAALAAHGPPRRGILHLLEATVWTFHAELGRAGLCHWWGGSLLLVRRGRRKRFSPG